MVNAQYSCKVARIESVDGCPLQPGSSLERTFILKPLAQNCSGMRGLCLDAKLSKVFTKYVFLKFFGAFVFF